MADTNPQLEAFLAGEPAPDDTSPAAPVESTPKPDAKADAKADAKLEGSEASPAAAAPKPDEDDAEPPEPSPGEPVVPRRALEDERHKRQNYVAQAAKFEAERDMLAKQLEELKRAPAQPAQPQPQPQYQPINPAQNPQGYHQQVQATLLNERLNMSADDADARNSARRRSRPRSPSSSSTPRPIPGCIRSCISRPIRMAGWLARSSGCG